MRIFIILIVFYYIQCFEFKCKHDEIKTKKSFRFTTNKKLLALQKQKSMPITEENTLPIRIKFHLLKDLIVGVDEFLQKDYLTYLDESLLPIAKNLFEKILKVIPRNKPIEFPFPECRDYIDISQVQQVNFEETDLLVIVKLVYEPSGQYLAFGQSCLQEFDEFYTGRVIGGLMAINLAKTDFTNEDINISSYIIIHEMIHILGFQQQLFNSYINPKTGQLYEFGEVFWDGKIRLKKTVQKAKEFFGCDSMNGIKLEQGQSRNHWNAKLMKQDVMEPYQYRQQAYLSEITLTMISEMGWYLVDFQYANIPNYGKNTGCQLNNESCDYKQYFCKKDSYQGCSFDAYSYGNCRIDPQTDNCSIPEYQGSCVIFNPLDTNLKNNEKFYAQEKSQDSRCFENQIFQKGKKNNINKFGCYKTECKKENLFVTVENKKYKCKDNKLLKINTKHFEGTLQCPFDITQVCQNTGFYQCYKQCNNNGVCIKENKCVCADGKDLCQVNTFLRNKKKEYKRKSRKLRKSRYL